MPATALGTVLDGIDAVLVTVEARTSFDVPAGGCRVIGLPDAAVKEGILRMRMAANPMLGDLPFKEGYGTLLNLAPADIRKAGRALDLPLAVAYSAHILGYAPEPLAKFLFLGEIALSGEIKPVTGAFAAALLAKRHGLSLCCAPENLGEARLVVGPRLFAARDLQEAMAIVRGEMTDDKSARGFDSHLTRHQHRLDLAEVKGQWLARRALEVAAAGGHNLLMEGPPGSGKSLLARRMTTILPPLDESEALESARIHASLRPLDVSRFREPPFRSPHHMTTPVGLVGGGHPVRPGEISLAHRGVLFLDELPEFPREALEVLREPMEERVVHMTRAGRSRVIPADALIVAAMNPCPCGHYGGGDGKCRCTPHAVARYRGRLSGPLLERFDLRVRLRAVEAKDLVESASGESSAHVGRRVQEARRRQHDRQGEVNARLQDADVLRVCELSAEDIARHRRQIEDLRLSARAARRLLRVARTLADMAGEASVHVKHLAEAASFRLNDETHSARG